jgi:hypothetical protein
VRVATFAVAALLLAASFVASALTDDAGGDAPRIEIKQIADSGDTQLNAAAATRTLEETTGAYLKVTLRAPERLVISGHAVPHNEFGIDLAVYARCTGPAGTIEVQRFFTEETVLQERAQTIAVEVSATRSTICEVAASAADVPIPDPRTAKPTEAYVELHCPTGCSLVEPDGLGTPAARPPPVLPGSTTP